MSISRNEVLWCYRLILGREPESELVLRKHMESESLSSLRKAFIRSPEFIRSHKPVAALRRAAFLPLDLPPIDVEYRATAIQEAESLAKIRAAWSHLGVTRPHFSVLTNKDFLPENIGQHAEEFWASGDGEATRVEKALARHGFTVHPQTTCVEYGCGVGRVTTGLARRFAHVHAYDISPGHLKLAMERMRAVGSSNCDFHLCDDNLLAELKKCDVFYSRIVFQHNPPPIIFKLISNALGSLNPGGIAIFQVPTYFIGYHFVIDEWIAAVHELDMQMHCLPQRVIFSLVNEEKCEMLEVREDASIGEIDRAISNTFIVRRRREP